MNYYYKLSICTKTHHNVFVMPNIDGLIPDWSRPRGVAELQHKCRVAE